jgi:hypothetical protein
MSIAKRAIPEATPIEEASQIIRDNWLNVIEEHHLKYSGNSQVNDILDIGCSVGVSTRYLTEKFPSAQAVVSPGISFCAWIIHKQPMFTKRVNCSSVSK